MWIGLLAACFILCCGAAAMASSPISIALKEKVFVDGEIVHLGDIAVVEGTDTAKTAKLVKLGIEKAPLPEKSLWVRKAHVIAKLELFGLSASDYHLTHNGAVEVFRRSVKVSPETIRQAVKAYIEAHSPWAANQLKIKNIRLKNPLHVPPGEMHISVQAPKHTDWLGATPFSVRVSVMGRLVKKITVAATIEVWSDVVLAARPLGRNQPVTPESIKIVRMSLSRAPSNAILSKDLVLGRRVNRSIAANSILRSDQVELPPVVKRGDILQVVARSRALKISVKGLAKENGALGERIRVQNIRSKRIIYAQVLDHQTVQVDF